MANTELFINPESVRSLADSFNTIASRISDTLNSVATEINNTESIYQAQSASDMRDRFNEIRSTIDKYAEYLKKVATYLVQNVADPADVVDQVASQNVAAIKKPN